MRRIVVNFQNALFSDAVGEALKSRKADFEMCKEVDPVNLGHCCRLIRPYAVLMEIAAKSPWTVTERLEQINTLKKLCSDTRFVFVVDDNDEPETLRSVEEAKKNGSIDQFIYSSVGTKYFVALIDSL